MTTTGMIAYNSIINEHPWMRTWIPDNFVRDIDGARQMFQFAAETERQALAVANKAISAHNRGALTASDYTNYDLFRHKVYDTQVAWLRQMRASLANVPGGSVYASRIPWPTWLAPLRASTPRNVPQMRLAAPPSGTAGLGVVGADDAVAWTGVAVTITIVIAVAVIAGVIITQFSSSFQNWIIVRAQTGVLSDAIDARTTAFNACVTAGTSAEACATQVQNAIPAPSQQAIDEFYQATSGKGVVWYVGLGAITLALGGLAYYGYTKGWYK